MDPITAGIVIALGFVAVGYLGWQLGGLFIKLGKKIKEHLPSHRERMRQLEEDMKEIDRMDQEIRDKEITPDHRTINPSDESSIGDKKISHGKKSMLSAAEKDLHKEENPSKDQDEDEQPGAGGMRE